MHDGICNFVCGRLRWMRRCVRVNSKNTHCECNGKNRQISPKQTLKKLWFSIFFLCSVFYGVRVLENVIVWWIFFLGINFVLENVDAERVWCTLVAVGYIGCVPRPQTGRDFFSTRCTSQNALAWNLLAIDPFSYEKKLHSFMLHKRSFPTYRDILSTLNFAWNQLRIDIITIALILQID